MIKAPIDLTESKRLHALKEYLIIDSLPDKDYDDITSLASYICQTPISLISLIDEDRQWFKSNHGLKVNETPRDFAFCAHAIKNKNEPLIIPDSRKDSRFKDNPLVTNDPNIVFYAGIPIVNPEGYPLGTLCVIDNKPRELSDEQLEALKRLTNQLLKLLELRKSAISLNETIHLLNDKNKKLNEFVRIAAHDIKSPMVSIIMSTDLVLDEYSDTLDTEGKKLIGYIQKSANHLSELVEGILKNSKSSSIASTEKEELNIRTTIDTIVSLLDSMGNVKFKISVPNGLHISCNKTALHQILVNLISNSIKYNDKAQTDITITVKDDVEFVVINIIDNGLGIKDIDKEKIFNLFTTTSNQDKEGFHGTGIGLATVKSLVERLGGIIKLESTYGKGSNFEFSIKK